MRKIVAVAFAILLAATVAYAQVPTSGNIFGGFSYGHKEVDAPSSCEQRMAAIRRGRF